MELKELKRAILLAAADLIAREQELCQLDSFVGDGDHGLTIKKGFANVIRVLGTEEQPDFHELLFQTGFALSDAAGGAIGPILASLFLGMAGAAEGKGNELDARDLADLFEAGLRQVQEIGGAQAGDRTLVDTLIPAVAALRQNQDAPVSDALGRMAQSACAGAQSTKEMVARKGRAHYLGEKSKGYVDAGAMSMYYFLRAFADSMAK